MNHIKRPFRPFTSKWTQLTVVKRPFCPAALRGWTNGHPVAALTSVVILTFKGLAKRLKLKLVPLKVWVLYPSPFSKFLRCGSCCIWSASRLNTAGVVGLSFKLGAKKHSYTHSDAKYRYKAAAAIDWCQIWYLNPLFRS